MDTEQEQLEALQRWWKENGTTLVIAVTVGFASLGGYLWWQDNSRRSAELISSEYYQLVDVAQQAAIEQPGAASAQQQQGAQEAIERTDLIISEYPESTYAGLAALYGARLSYERNEPATSRRFLLWASEHAAQDFIKSVARIRLARLQLDEEQTDQALKTLDDVQSAALAAMVTELKADILFSKGDFDAAKSAYESLLGDDLDTLASNRIQQKLDSTISRAGT